MKAIVTITGLDRVGIIAAICSLLASKNVNILDISQTVMQGFFTMTMLTDTAEANCGFEELRQALIDKGQEMGLTAHIQREDIFTAMHRI